MGQLFLIWQQESDGERKMCWGYADTDTGNGKNQEEENDNLLKAGYI